GAAGRLSVSFLPARRWLHVVWYRFSRDLPAGGVVRRSDPQGRQAGRAAGAALGQVRTRRQSQDRESTRPHDPRAVPPACGRGDRMIGRREFVTLLAGILALASGGRAAIAQGYPAAPVKPIVTTGAGGAPDVIARTLAAG